MNPPTKAKRSITPTITTLGTYPPEEGEIRGRTEIQIEIKLSAPVKRCKIFKAVVCLQKGNPVTAFKDGLCALEGEIGLHFESFEAVDLARLFFAEAQAAGFSIKGFPPLAPADPQPEGR